MKIEKMSFRNIKDVLSKQEMKKIMAGSEPECIAMHNECTWFAYCCPGMVCKTALDLKDRCFLAP